MDKALEASALKAAGAVSSGTTAGSTTIAAHPLSLLTKLLYGAPNLAAGAMIIPLAINMPKFYADDVSAIFPSNVPVFRCSLSSTGSLGLVPPLPR